MTRQKLWTTTVLLAVSGAWIGCEPMSKPMVTPTTPIKESKPAEKTPDVTPEKPAESSEKADPATKDEYKKPDEEKKADETKSNEPEKTDA